MLRWVLSGLPCVRISVRVCDPGGFWKTRLAQIGPDWLQEVQIGPKRPRLAQEASGSPDWLKLAPGSLWKPRLVPDWPRLVPGGPDWPRLAPGGPKRLQEAQTGSRKARFVRLAQNVPRRPQEAQIGFKRFQEAQIGPGWPGLAPGCLWRPRLAQTGPRRPRLAPTGPSRPQEASGGPFSD